MKQLLVIIRCVLCILLGLLLVGYGISLKDTSEYWGKITAAGGLLILYGGVRINRPKLFK